jgi:endonuclease/exonuclease/phosphatase family metal-dependent hydrolase
MSFTVLTWNVQRWCVGSDQQKTNYILAEIAKYTPDLLGLTEIGESIANGNLIPNYQCVGYANTLDKNFDGSNLCIAWFMNTGYAGRFTKARALHNMEQRRAKLKINIVDTASNANYQLYLVHADASKKGGEGAVTEAIAEVVKYDDVVYMGDMNYDFNKDSQSIFTNASLNVMVPRDPSGAQQTYSQGTHYRGHLLDGAITSVNTTAKAKKSKTKVANWSFATVDHTPVFLKIG